MHNHEHHHEHHHTHPHEEGCGCHDHEHDHSHEHDHAPRSVRCGQFSYTIDAYHHESACVASGTCVLVTSEPERVKAWLKEEMNHLAQWVSTSGGYIGHIKAGLEASQTTMFSITDTDLTERKSEKTQLKINLAVIALLVELDDLRTRAEDILSGLCRGTTGQADGS